jgi:hypothetical protein
MNETFHACEVTPTEVQPPPAKKPRVDPVDAAAKACKCEPPFKEPLDCEDLWGDDVFVVRGLMQRLGYDPADILEELASLPKHGPEAIEFKPHEPCFIPGSHSVFNGRQMKTGIPRDKVFMQQEGQGFWKYAYTYWKYATALATKYLSAGELSHTAAFLEGMNGLLRVPHNTWIGTMYKDGDDCIAPHTDKMVDLDPDAWIVVWRLGAPRIWELYNREEEGAEFQVGKKDEPVVEFEVQGGDAIFMNARGNSYVKHGMPEVTSAGLSGSIVGRTSQSLMSWAAVQKRA